MVVTGFPEVLLPPDADESEDVADLLHEDDGGVVELDHAAALVVERRSLRFVSYSVILSSINR